MSWIPKNIQKTLEKINHVWILNSIHTIINEENTCLFTNSMQYCFYSYKMLALWRKKKSKQPHHIPAFTASHNMYKTGTRRSGYLQTSIPRGETEKPREVLQPDNTFYRLGRLWVVVSGEWKTTGADGWRSRKWLFPIWDWWWLPPGEIRSNI